MHARVKFCGMTGVDDVVLAGRSGASHFGMIFAPSERRIAWSAAEAIARELSAESPIPVAVFVDPSRDEVGRVLELFPQALLQFSGNESPSWIAPYARRAVKVIHVGAQDATGSLRERCNRYEEATVMFDTGSTGLAGGSGTPFAWEIVEPIARERPVWIAGGLRAQNVTACITAIHPFGVDARSGIETDGRKDFDKMRAFITAVRDSDAT